MKKFGIQIERSNKIQFPISIDKICCFKSISQSPFMSRTFLILQRDSVFAYLFNAVFRDIFYHNTTIYREILLKFLQFTEKYYINRTPFHFRRLAEAVLRRAARLSKAFSMVRPSTPEKWFYTQIWAVLCEKVLARLNTARRLKQALMLFHKVPTKIKRKQKNYKRLI